MRGVKFGFQKIKKKKKKKNLVTNPSNKNLLNLINLLLSNMSATNKLDTKDDVVVDKIVVKNTDMSNEMIESVKKLTFESLKQAKDQSNNDNLKLSALLAKFLKKSMDKIHNPTWQCCVGTNFGSGVIHEDKRFINFYINDYVSYYIKQDFYVVIINLSGRYI